ncbi:hypothetical protein BN946_scf184497.g10 [Trametes cinnabarina]|uniref:Nephrocystin 3-like N-terminal domain-containing protein n=1 Tax=Pycnoporus cinnabarinus TaxID=5643 RepID=A0A060SSV3_PYCCI|nr:hypothetical protein BN946_scf184497.g10 [Trametes cinnabarina]
MTSTRRPVSEHTPSGASNPTRTAQLVAPGNGPQLQDASGQETHRAHKRKLVHSIVSHLLLALQITQELSGSQPALQLATGALIVVLKAYEKCSSNTEAIEALRRQIERLNTMLKNVLPTDQERCPPALRNRLENFAKDLREIADDAREIQSQWLIVRLTKASEIEGKIEDSVKTISWLIQCLIVEGTIAVELAVHEMAEDTRQGFQNLYGRLDRVDEELDGVRQDISQLGTDAIPGLRYAPNARFDYARGGRSECDPETRREVLASLWSWLMPNDPRLETLPDSLFTVPQGYSMLWVKAMAGAGKTTVAQTVAEWCAEANILGASFFCGRDGARSDVLRIVQNIAQDLAAHSPDFREALCAAAKAKPHIQTAHVSQQLKSLVVEPLHKAKTRGSFPPNLVVLIDGLDECHDDEATSVILQALSLHIADLSPVRFIVTSRPAENITRGYRVLEDLKKVTFEFALDRIPAQIARRDIATYMRYRLAEIKRRRLEAGFTCDPQWPSPVDFESLVSLTDSLFIFAATAIRFIDDPGVSDPESQLASLLASTKGGKVLRSSTSPYWQLDALYLEALRTAFPSLSASLRSIVKLLLGTIAVVEEQLSPAGLEALLRLRPGTARGTLNRLQSIIYVPPVEEEPKPTRFLHLSFPDFITDPSRCDSPDFLVKPSLQHTVIALRCLEAMGSLKQNFCEIDWSNDHLLNTEIPGLSEKIAERFSPALSYACKYWSHHLCRAELGEDLLRALENFCHCHLLHWLEALSLLGCVDVALNALQSAQHYLKEHASPTTDIPALLNDCECMVRTFYPPINASFFQVYKSALVLSPKDSLVRRLHNEDVPRTVLVRVGDIKGWKYTVVLAPPGMVEALDFSPDGKSIATSTAGRGCMQIWDTQTAAELQVCHGDTSGFSVVSFSPTGREILSGSRDGTVRLWDVVSGACLGVWKRHSAQISTVAWSTDRTLAASGAEDGTIALWPLDSPDEVTVLDHGGKIWNVVFARDGSLLSASENGTCRIWDTLSLSTTRVLEHHSPIRAVAVSPDSRLVACGTGINGDILVWKSEDGRLLQVLSGGLPGIKVISLTFHADARLFAGYDIGCAQWDLATPAIVAALSAIPMSNRTVAFSPDGVLVAHTPGTDVAIEEWPAQSLQGTKRHTTRWKSAMTRFRQHFTEYRELAGPSVDARALTYDASISPSGHLIIVINEGRMQWMDALSGQYVRTIQDDDGRLRRVVCWSPSSGFFATGVDSWHAFHVWDASTGRCTRVLTGHSDMVSAVSLAHDGRGMVTASWDGTIRRFTWDWQIHSGDPNANMPDTSSEVMIHSSEVIFRCDGQIWAMAVSSDGKWIVSASKDNSLPDTSSAGLIAKPSKRPVKDGSGTYPTIRLHEASGRVIWIEHHWDIMTALGFSDDGMRIVAGNMHNQIFFYDISALIQTQTDVVVATTSFTATAQPPTPVVHERVLIHTSKLPLRQIAFSPDGRGIITDRTYNPLDPTLAAQSSPRGGENAVLPAARFIDDQGWLWRVEPYSKPRRLCWLPYTFRPVDNPWANTWSVRGDIIPYSTADRRLVVLDTSRC